MCIGTLEPRKGATPHPEEGLQPTPPYAHTLPPMSSPSAHAQKRALRAEAVRVSDMVLRAIFVKRVDSLDLRVWAQAARALRETL